MSVPRGTSSAVAAILLLAVVAATALLGSSASSAPIRADSGEQRMGSVTERTLVCPVLRRDGDSQESLTVLTAPAATGDPDGGDIRQPGAPPMPLPAPGESLLVTPGRPTATVAVRTAGARVSTTATVRSWLDPADEGRGLALGQCLPPRSDWWFVGVSARPGQIDELLLANPTESPAVVGLEVYGPNGPVPLVGVRGVVVQPGREESLRVDSLVPGIDRATLRVVASAGVVAAAVRSTAIDGLVPQGAEYLPPATEPSTGFVVPGLLPGEGQRSLVLTAGARDAAVTVGLVTPGGKVERPSGQMVPVPAGTTVEVDLGPIAKGRAAAVLVESTAPVTGAARSVVKGAVAEGATGVLNRVPVADVAWTAAADPIEVEQVLPLAGVPEAPGGVLVTAVGGSAEVTMEARAANGAEFRTTFELAADTSREVRVPVEQGHATVLSVVAQGEGRVYAASMQFGQAPTGPLAAAAIGQERATAVPLPSAYPVPAAVS